MSLQRPLCEAGAGPWCDLLLTHTPPLSLFCVIVSFVSFFCVFSWLLLADFGRWNRFTAEISSTHQPLHRSTRPLHPYRALRISFPQVRGHSFTQAPTPPSQPTHPLKPCNPSTHSPSRRRAPKKRRGAPNAVADCL